jgi:hypothetical protein
MRLYTNLSLLGKYFYDFCIRLMCVYLYTHTHRAVNVHEQQSGLHSLWEHESLILVKKICHKYRGLCNILVAIHYLNVGCEVVT